MRSNIEKKREHLGELVLQVTHAVYRCCCCCCPMTLMCCAIPLQQIAFRKLVARNTSLASAANRAFDIPVDRRLQLPFIVVTTSDQTTIQLEMDTPHR